MRLRAVVSGALAALLALGVAELVAGTLGGSSLVVTVGNLVVDVAPPWLEDFGIAVFGIHDKTALLVGIVVVAGLVGGALGGAALRRLWPAVVGFAAFAALGVGAALRDPGADPGPAVLAAGAGAGVGLLALAGLLRRLPDPADPVHPDLVRRSFLRAAGSVGVAAVLAGAVGRWLLELPRAVATGRDEVVLPRLARSVLPPAPAAQVELVDPVVTPNDRFYRIDTALVVPRIDPGSWSLRVTGLVDRPYEITYRELLGMRMEEAYVTLACVSNPVGGDLVGNAAWLGVPLSRLLERAGVREGATQIVGRAADGFTVGFPTAAAFDGRRALVAVGMNGEPLPYQHGFPARLVVAGLYGYVSATKWLTEIELTTWEGFDAYWVPRGWAKEGPIKTQSRIDLPRDGDRLEPGLRPVAGVAWAPGRGITGVEVRVDGGPWREARLAESLTDDAWRQWVAEWEAGPGPRTLEVRATDGTGEVQVAERRPPRPDGATGHHAVRVTVG